MRFCQHNIANMEKIIYEFQNTNILPRGKKNKNMQNACAILGQTENKEEKL